MNDIATPLRLELLEELKGIVTEGVFTSRWALIETYHKVGQILVEHETELPIKEVATELKMKERVLFQCRQFFRTYPDINKLPNGKAISWHKIANQLLPTPKADKPTEEEKLLKRIDAFIEDMFVGERKDRKEFITKVVSDWELWQNN